MVLSSESNPKTWCSQLAIKGGPQGRKIEMRGHLSILQAAIKSWGDSSRLALAARKNLTAFAFGQIAEGQNPSN
jgi:hypothetical protein